MLQMIWGLLQWLLHRASAEWASHVLHEDEEISIKALQLTSGLSHQHLWARLVHLHALPNQAEVVGQELPQPKMMHRSYQRGHNHQLHLLHPLQRYHAQQLRQEIMSVAQRSLQQRMEV